MHWVQRGSRLETSGALKLCSCNLLHLHRSAYVRKFLISGAVFIFSPIYPVANTWSVFSGHIVVQLCSGESSAQHQSAQVWAIRFCTVAPAPGTPSALSTPCTPPGWAPSKGSPSPSHWVWFLTWEMIAGTQRGGPARLAIGVPWDTNPLHTLILWAREAFSYIAY